MASDIDTQTYANDSATSSSIDTGLTQPRSPDVLRDLIVRRRKVGAESREGRLLSNLIKQTAWLNDTSGDRSWAKHPTQTVAWMMKVQLKALAN